MSEDYKGAIDKIKDYCESWIESGQYVAQLARERGNAESARGFENRTTALQGVVAIMEQYGINTID